MRIAYVINSMEGGGACAPLPAVVRVLQAEGVRVEVFALLRRDGLGLPALERDGVTVHVRNGAEGDHLSALVWLDAALAAFDPDAIWTSQTRATVLGQMVGAHRQLPVISWQHNACLKPANALLLRVTRRLSDLWIGDSQSVTTLTGRRLRVPPQRLTSWPLFAADPAAPHARPWRPGQPLRIGSLGRLHPAQGYDVLIRAIALLKRQKFSGPAPFEIAIAGQGQARSALQAAIDAADLSHVRLVGPASQPRDFMAGLHLYVQPSRREGLCLAAHEAMQAGLPVIVSAVGEMPFSVMDKVSGLIVTPGDVRDLADALAELLAEPERLAAMGEASRDRTLARFGAEAFHRNGARIVASLRR